MPFPTATPPRRRATLRDLTSARVIRVFRGRSILRCLLDVLTAPPPEDVPLARPAQQRPTAPAPNSSSQP